jgi:hypothetical protein
MWLLVLAGASKGDRSRAAALHQHGKGSPAHKLPFAGIIQIRFRGCFSPAPRLLRFAGPLACVLPCGSGANYTCGALHRTWKFCNIEYSHVAIKCDLIINFIYEAQDIITNSHAGKHFLAHGDQYNTRCQKS